MSNSLASWSSHKQILSRIYEFNPDKLKNIQIQAYYTQIFDPQIWLNMNGHCKWEGLEKNFSPEKGKKMCPLKSLQDKQPPPFNLACSRIECEID